MMRTKHVLMIIAAILVLLIVILVLVAAPRAGGTDFSVTHTVLRPADTGDWYEVIVSGVSEAAEASAAREALVLKASALPVLPDPEPVPTPEPQPQPQFQTNFATSTAIATSSADIVVATGTIPTNNATTTE